MAAAAIHPGEHLAEELKTLDMSAAELARKLHVPTNRITQILNGQRAITGDTALRLAHFFSTSPEFWLNLQSLYELRRAQQKAGKAIKGLSKLKRSEPVRLKTYDLRKLPKAITAKNRPNAVDFGPPQGKEVW
jgi:antitoxin HigA-1